ncbi:MAG: hypothetical protein ACFBSF_11025 [Leptolyngbyaceae cyanobacterium]
MTLLNTQSEINSISSGVGSSFEALKSLAQEVHSESRLQQYRLETQQEAIRALKEKVETLELHKATQLGQDKIVGFMVGAIVLSLLSLATSIFFSPPQRAEMVSMPHILETDLSV